MRFFQVIVSGAALVSSALALTIDTYPTGGVQAGQTYTITYSPKDQTPTTFVLRRGASTNLDTVGEIGTATGGTFTWTVPRDLADASTYALQAKQAGGVENYSGQFSLSGGSGSLSASSALASASAAVSSARASASSALASLSSRVSSAASATISPSAGTNSTVSSATLSRTASASASGTSRPSASTTSGGPPQSTGAASALESSPLALVFGAIAAIAYLY